MKQAETLQQNIHLKTLQKGINSITEYAIVTLDKEGHVVSWNEGAQRIKGYTAAEIIGQPFTCFYKPGAIQAHYPEHLLEEALKKGHAIDEGWRVRKDASSFWARVTITPVYDDFNKHIGFIKVTQDLTECKLAELSLMYSLNNYRTITDMSPAGVLHIDSDFTLLYANQCAYEIMGLSPEKAKDKGWLDAIHPLDKPKVINSWDTLFRENRVLYDEFRFLHQDGKEFWVLCMARPDEGKQGLHTYIQVVIDINQQKMMEQKEKERLAAAEKLEQEQRRRAEDAEGYKSKLTEYINLIMHNLRNPLMGIQGSNSFIKQDIKEINSILDEATTLSPIIKEKLANYLKDINEMTESINTCVQHSAYVTNKVLDLSRVESDSKKLAIQPFHVQDLLATVEKMYGPKIREKGLKFIVKKPQDDLWVNSDKHTLELVLANLITNAIKFTAKGYIALSLNIQEINSKNVTLQFTLKDTGRGMTDQEQKGLFNRFKQANDSISHQYGGYGLGLYINQQLVKLMGGNIKVESEKGKGTTFSFTVCCTKLSQEEQQKISKLTDEESQTTPSLKPESPKIILIVEDNPINQKVLAKQLSQKGYQISIANNGVEALEKWQKFFFDAILMDIEMPKMNGLEATKQIRKTEETLNKPSVPIIGLTGNAHPEQKEAALKAGMNDYLVKPYKPTDIYRILSEHLDKSTALRQQESNISSQVDMPIDLQRPKAVETENEERPYHENIDKIPIDKLAKAGLCYISIPGDGHCLYNSVSLYLGETADFLRKIVAAHLEYNSEVFSSFIPLPEDKSFSDYINDVRNGNEWASHVEIEVLMRVLGRPILVVGTDLQIINSGDQQRFEGEPIFVYYNGHDHYDGLTLQPGLTVQAVLANLQGQSTMASPSARASNSALSSKQKVAQAKLKAEELHPNADTEVRTEALPDLQKITISDVTSIAQQGSSSLFSVKQQPTEAASREFAKYTTGVKIE